MFLHRRALLSNILRYTNNSRSGNEQTGQAAGVALRAGAPVTAVNPEELREALRKQGAARRACEAQPQAIPPSSPLSPANPTSHSRALVAESATVGGRLMEKPSGKPKGLSRHQPFIDDFVNGVGQNANEVAKVE